MKRVYFLPWISDSLLLANRPLIYPLWTIRVPDRKKFLSDSSAEGLIIPSYSNKIKQKLSPQFNSNGSCRFCCRFPFPSKALWIRVKLDSDDHIPKIRNFRLTILKSTSYSSEMEKRQRPTGGRGQDTQCVWNFRNLFCTNGTGI